MSPCSDEIWEGDEVDELNIDMSILEADKIPMCKMCKN